ncbi:MAG: methyl-accepting chemotaxis protein [Desulfovibrio sp.]
MFDFAKKSLNAKIGLLIMTITILVFAILVSITSYWQRSGMISQMEEALTRTSELIHSAVSKPMVVGNDAGTKQEFVDLSNRYKDINVYITNYKGNITYSTKKETVRTDLSSSFNHPEAKALISGSLKTNHASNVLLEQGDKFLYMHSMSIPNEPTCYHCHGSSEPILGEMLLVQDVTHVMNDIDFKLYETIGLSVAGIILLICTVFIFLRKVVIQRVEEIKNGTDLIATGDMNVTFPNAGEDELGQLCSNLNLMIRRLRGVIGEVNCATTNVAAGSSELSDSSNTIAQGATEQAASIEEISSSMEEMTANIQHNTENARETESISTQAAVDAEAGGSTVQRTVDVMRNIAEKIIVVEEIARQTNLLALNAAIEAARAGEHGKGFAVVASEVRKLAERSGLAASEISELSGSSVAVAEEAGAMLTKLVPEIQRTAELVQEIAASSEEQTSGASQINRAIQQLDSVVQQNASAAEEMASSAVELSGQGDQLKRAMQFFKVDESLMNEEACNMDDDLQTTYELPSDSDLTRY